MGEQLVEISKLVSEAIDKATTAFEGADVDLAEDVIAADAQASTSCRTAWTSGPSTSSPSRAPWPATCG